MEVDKHKYVETMLKMVDVNKATETWEDFLNKNKDSYLRKEGRLPDFFTDFMELDEADMSYVDILCSDDAFYKYVIGGNDGSSMRIVNNEVLSKWKKTIHAEIPDHMQVEIEGRTGVGKSTAMISLCLWLYPKFDERLIHYLKRDLLDFIKINKNLVKDNVICLDEDVEDSGFGSRRTEKEVNQILESSRRAKVSFIRCRAVGKHENKTARYLFHCFCKNVKRRITCLAVYIPDKFGNPCCIGMLVLRIPFTEKFFGIEYEYSKKKDKFIDDTLLQENVSNIDTEKMAKDILDNTPLLKTLKKISKKDLELLVFKKHNNVSTKEQSMIVNECDLLLRAGYLNDEIKNS